MRIPALMSAAAVLALAGAAQAQTVNVSIGPKLQEKADEYGQRELEHLARDLQRAVERRVAGAPGAYELVIVDAVPNRPTFEQLGDKPGLSPRSFGVGGATIEGFAVAADGSRTPVSYRWYEGDIRSAWHETTWGDAHTAFNRFASRLASGRLYAQR
ncbi:MAG TPA: hypothetical protein VD906_02945 [Caulobacteraceae bacterium]|nr:hypothetical protein [Caulobacteraceae bacterium]